MQTAASSPRTIRRVASLPLPHDAKATRSTSFGLIIPPSVFVVPRGWEWVHTAPFEGPSIIASLVKGLGYPFRLFDRRDSFEPEQLRGLTTGYDILGISVYGDSFKYVRDAVDIFKQEMPGRPVILGGPLATAAPQLLLQSTRADYVVAGEGELTLTELLEAITGDTDAFRLEEIPGLVWRDASGAIRANPARLQLEDLDAVPFQDHSVWERFAGKEIPEIYLSYSRGCAHNCTFCFRTFPKLSLKSVGRVRKEIEYYAPRGFRMAWWNDLTFVTDKTHVHRLMQEALGGHPFRWTAFSRVAGMDDETLLLMKEKGLDIVLYGMESVSKCVLDNYRKGITRNAMIDTIERHRRCGVKIGGLFIVGAPADTREGMAELVAFCGEFKEVTRVKYLSALPGTAFYRQCLEDGLIRDEVKHLEWLSEEQSIEEDIEHPDFVMFTKNLTKGELREVYRKVNGCIEARPYDYLNRENVFLEQGEKFLKRKPGTTGGAFH